MKYRINSISTPIGGISWEEYITEKDRIRHLFLYLESKRILTNPISLEIVEQCVSSVLEIRNKLVEITMDVKFCDSTLSYVREMINACNVYLNSVNTMKPTQIIYKNNGRWEDLNFDKAMKTFRKSFKQAIKRLEEQTGVRFNGRISDKW